MGSTPNTESRSGTFCLIGCLIAALSFYGCKGGDKLFASCSPSNIELCPTSAGYANPYEANLELLSWTETLRKASLELTGKLPTQSQIAVTEQHGQLGLEASVWEMMREDAFYDRIKEIYNDRFLTNKYLDRENAIDLLDEEVFPNLRWYESYGDETRELANDSLAREALELIAYVVRTDRPFTEILTADYTMVNGYSAPSLIGYPGIPLEISDDPMRFRKAKIAGVPHAGILTSPMFLNRFPTSDTNRNRHRSRMAYQFFIDVDINQFGNRPVDANEAEGDNPTLTNPDCTVCHTTLDPAAGCFMNWDESGRFDFDEPGQWHEDMLPPGFSGIPLPEDRRDSALQWLAEQLSDHPGFARATVKTMFAGLTGQQPLTPSNGQTPPPPPPVVDAGADSGMEVDGGMDAGVGDAGSGDAGSGDGGVINADTPVDRAYETQQLMLQTMGARFFASDHNFKVLVREIILSPYFRAKNANSLSTDLEVELAPFGTARFLTPEHLTRKIQATTGVRWKPRFNNRDYLLNDYLIFYGGIDSDLVTKRILEPNGVMSSLAQRMAYEVSCSAVPFDFSKFPEDRLLFPSMEITELPTVDEDKVRAAIVHLHDRLLGEVLGVNDEEVTATLKLLKDTHNLGKLGIGSETVSADLPDACRLYSDPLTGDDLPGYRHMRNDELYTIRSWMAVVSYLLSDFRFLYE